MSILEKISEEERCGVDFKYDDEYIAIELEIEKNFNVSNTGTTQWDMVLLKCENVLVNHSKDLKILSYWLYAQQQLNGWPSFFKALNSYVSILEIYNKELFPKTDKRKIKIFEWTENVLEEQLAKVVENLNKSDLTHLYEKLEAIRIVLPSVIDTEINFLKTIRVACKQSMDRIEREEEDAKKQIQLQREEELKSKREKETFSKVEAERRSEEAEVLSKFSSREKQESTHSFVLIESLEINLVQSTILPLANNLLTQFPGDYIGYKVLFSLAEILFEESFRDASIQIDDFIPSNDIIQAARGLEEDKGSLYQLEVLIEQLLLRPTWVEGYYIISKVLYKLSQTNDAMQIESMLFYFLTKEERIMAISVGEQKLVPEHVASWMETKLLSLQGKVDNSIEYQHAYHEVLKLKKEQNTQNALMVLEEHYEKAKGEESRFRWRLLMVDFALEIGDKKLALALLYELEQKIEKYRIDLWQPLLAIGVFETLSKSIFTQELSAETKERIYSKLSILDLKKVIKY